jgi:hypothetical protein
MNKRLLSSFDRFKAAVPLSTSHVNWRRLNKRCFQDQQAAS